MCECFFFVFPTWAGRWERGFSFGGAHKFAIFDFFHFFILVEKFQS